MQIQDRVFIVTGASMGIGEATARALTAKGARVALLARSYDLIEALSKELPESLAVACDMTDLGSVRSAVATVHTHYGQINGLVNNAGRSYAATVETIDPEAFLEIYRLNVLGPIAAMQAVIPVMRYQGGGSIVNVNSGTAFMTIPQYGVYSSSKRALLGITQTARIELAPDGIVVGEVYPFVTATNFGKNRMGNSGPGAPSTDYSTGDSPAFVAGLIIGAIETGEAQVYANERMREMAGG